MGGGFPDFTIEMRFMMTGSSGAPLSSIFTLQIRSTTSRPSTISPKQLWVALNDGSATIVAKNSTRLLRFNDAVVIPNRYGREKLIGLGSDGIQTGGMPWPVPVGSPASNHCANFVL